MRLTPAQPPSPSESAPSRDEGQATVEFAMILPILCVLLFAIVEFGMAFWSYQQVSAAASEGARRAAVSANYGDRTTRVQNAAREASPGLTPGQMTVSTVSTWNPGDPATVTVEYPEDIKIMGVTLFNKNLKVVRTQRVEQ